MNRIKELVERVGIVTVGMLFVLMVMLYLGLNGIMDRIDEKFDKACENKSYQVKFPELCEKEGEK